MNLRKKFDLILRVFIWKLQYSADLNEFLIKECFQDIFRSHDLSKEFENLILTSEQVDFEHKVAGSVSISIILDSLDAVITWS